MHARLLQGQAKHPPQMAAHNQLMLLHQPSLQMQLPMKINLAAQQSPMAVRTQPMLLHRPTSQMQLPGTVSPAARQTPMARPACPRAVSLQRIVPACWHRSGHCSRIPKRGATRCWQATAQEAAVWRGLSSYSVRSRQMTFPRVNLAHMLVWLASRVRHKFRMLRMLTVVICISAASHNNLSRIPAWPSQQQLPSRTLVKRLLMKTGRMQRQCHQKPRRQDFASI